MLLYDELPSESLVYMEVKIQEFLRSFVTRYPEARIIPKLHYLVHYPRMISFRTTQTNLAYEVQGIKDEKLQKHM